MTEESKAVDKLIEITLNNDGKLKKLEKLIELKQGLNKKESVKSFNKAMSDFQGKKPVLKKTVTADLGKEKYNYIPLSKIQQAIDPILSDVGLSYRWTQEQDSESISVNCIVSHIDGHSETSSLNGPYDSETKSRIHSIGSSMSYLKRYTLEAALGLSSDDDDDGESAPNELPLLKAKTKGWTKAKESLLSGRIGVDGIEKIYKLTPQVKEALWAILREQLKSEFEKKKPELSQKELDNIKRIIEKEETLSYKKSLVILNKI